MSLNLDGFTSLTTLISSFMLYLLLLTPTIRLRLSLVKFIHEESLGLLLPGKTTGYIPCNREKVIPRKLVRIIQKGHIKVQVL